MLSDRPIVAGPNWAVRRRKEADATREKKQGADLIVPPIYQRCGNQATRAVESEIKVRGTQITTWCVLARQLQ